MSDDSADNLTPDDGAADPTQVLAELAAVLESRKTDDPSSSYVASLYAAGIDKILKKVGEEATETIVAAKNGETEQLVYETADLWFHTMIMLADQGLGPQDVIRELARRMGVSGLVEKNSRTAQKPS